MAVASVAGWAWARQECMKEGPRREVERDRGVFVWWSTSEPTRECRIQQQQQQQLYSQVALPHHCWTQSRFQSIPQQAHTNDMIKQQPTSSYSTQPPRPPLREMITLYTVTLHSWNHEHGNDGILIFWMSREEVYVIRLNWDIYFLFYFLCASCCVALTWRYLFPRGASD